MSFFNDYDGNDSILGKRRKGTIDDPYLPINEDIQIVGNKAQLTEIPNKVAKVVLSGLNVTWIEKSNGDLTEDEFRVDYNEGIVSFHPTRNLETLKFDYLGEGITNISSSRVWTKRSGSNVSETLNEAIDSIDSTTGTLKSRIDSIIIEAGSGNTAIDAARYNSVDDITYTTLSERLDTEQTVVNSRLSEISYNVKAYGVNGVVGVNEGVAVQSVFNMVGNLGGGELYFPTGTYSFRNIDIPSNVRIKASPRAIFKLQDHGNSPLFIIDGKTDIELDGLKIDGNGSNNTSISLTSAVILISNSKRIKINRTEIRKPPTSAIRFNSSSFCQVTNSYLSGQYDDSSTIEQRINQGNEQALVYCDACDYMVVSDNTIINGATNGVKFRATSPSYSKHNIVERNSVKSNYFIGLANGRIAYTSINDNNCSYNGDNGIDVNGSINVSITGNNCCYNGQINHDPISNGANPEGDGIYYGENGCKSITITGNVCSYNTRAGIGNVADSDYAVITGNILCSNDIGMQHANGLYWNISDNIMLDNSTAGLYITTFFNGLDTTISRGIIANNFFKDTIGTGVGVKLSNGGKGIFTDNILTGNFGVDWTTQAFASTTGTSMSGGDSGRYSSVKSLSSRDDLKWNVTPFKKSSLASGVTSVTINLGADMGRNNYYVQVTPSWNSNVWVPSATITNSSFVVNFGTATPDANQFIFAEVKG